MKCPRCGADVTLDIKEASHDENFIDISAKCDNEDCGYTGYTFIPASDIVESTESQEKHEKKEVEDHG